MPADRDFKVMPPPRASTPWKTQNDLQWGNDWIREGNPSEAAISFAAKLAQSLPCLGLSFLSWQVGQLIWKFPEAPVMPCSVENEVDATPAGADAEPHGCTSRVSASPHSSPSSPSHYQGAHWASANWQLLLQNLSWIQLPCGEAKEPLWAYLSSSKRNCKVNPGCGPSDSVKLQHGLPEQNSAERLQPRVNEIKLAGSGPHTEKGKTISSPGQRVCTKPKKPLPKSHKAVNWLFSRNSVGQKGMAWYI